MILFGIITGVMLCGIAAVLLLNVFTFPRLRQVDGTPTIAGKVSILIPARNEAAVIGRTVQMLRQQIFTHFELLILDDQSSDGTSDVIQQAAAGDERVRIINGKPPPADWSGKNWACHQLSQSASGDFLIFTDADVQWQPGALAALLTYQAYSRADLLTVWPTQETITLAERLVVPLMGMVILGYLPVLAVHHIPWAIFAAANGQCLLFRRAAYQALGGHTSARKEIVEDVVLARRIKAQGLRLRMIDGAGLIGCRMYQDWASVRAGFAKNILAGHGNSQVFLAFSTVVHWSLFIVPLIWLLFDAGGEGWPAFPIGLIVLGLLIRALSAAFTRQRVLDAFGMPGSVVLMTLIAARSVWWQWRFGGPRWKDRTIVVTEQGQHG
jgi:chlorobactene glucosyltransferase